jgi:uncharacterized protein (DUF58 family)
VIPIPWAASAFAGWLVALSGLCLTLSLSLGRADLAALAAVPAAWLVLPRRRPEPSALRIEVDAPPRCLEGEPFHVRVRVRCDKAPDLCRVALKPGQGVRVVEGPAESAAAGSGDVALGADLVADRWGVRTLGTVTVECWTRNRLRRARIARLVGVELRVYPRPDPVHRLPPAATRFDRTGDHPAAVAGAGVEFHSIRPLTRGDRPRQVNWPVSTRRGELHVTATRAELAADTVVAIDVRGDIGPPGRGSRDLAVRGATGIVQRALAAHDRVGLVVLGGRLQWLRPDHTQRQLYRITDAVLDVADWVSSVEPDASTIPYTALPFGAHVVYFSPLLDEASVDVARTLRSRGHPVTVLDVCVGEPPAEPEEQLALRLWRLDREATRKQLEATGVLVVAWDGSVPVEAVLAPVARLQRAPR